MPESRPSNAARPAWEYQAKLVEEIIIRRFNFDFPSDLDPKWSPAHVVRSHLFNGFSLTMPYLEPFLIKTLQEASAHIEDPRLLDDIRGFNGQEAQHYQCHRRLNELLKANGYPEFAALEARMQKSYARLSKKSLRTRLAYSAGFESMTNGFTSWFVNKRWELFGGASPHVPSFWLMHMIEEAEHKTVAYDAYMACSGEYLPRAFGVLHGSFHVLGYGLFGMCMALRKDGDLYHPRRLIEIAREILALAANVGPSLLKAMLPGYNPRNENEPQWVTDWLAGHATLAEGALIPLVDTSNSAMPVPFPVTHARPA